jgi:hypothetical protein
MSDWLRGHVLTLANSPFFKAVEEMGGAPSGPAAAQRGQYGTEAPGDSNEFGGGIAKIFDRVHHGPEPQHGADEPPGQPLHNVHQFGFANSAKAYGQTINQMAEYAKARYEPGQQRKSGTDRGRDASSTIFRDLEGGVRVKLREISRHWQRLGIPCSATG